MSDDVSATHGNAGPSEKWFGAFTLIGERFEARGLPATAAIEVGRYREALYQLAREMWLAENPHRYRVPNNFDDAFDLRLVQIDEGSSQTRVLLRRAPKFSDPEYDEWFAIFERTPGALAGTINAVADEQESVPLPNRARSAIRSLGRSLDNDETIIIAPSDSAPAASKAQLTERVRVTLARIDEATAPVEREVSIEGVITEFDSRRQSFQLAADRGRVECLLPHYIPHLASVVRQVLAEDGVTAPDVLVSGYAIPDSHGHFRRIHNVSSIVTTRSATEKRFLERANTLAELSDGWLGPGSVAPNEALGRLTEAAGEIGELAMPIAIGANDRGHVVLEWSAHGVEYTAEIEPEGMLYLVIDDPANDRLEDAHVPWNVTSLRRFVVEGALQ